MNELPGFWPFLCTVQTIKGAGNHRDMIDESAKLVTEQDRTHNLLVCGAALFLCATAAAAEYWKLCDYFCIHMKQVIFKTSELLALKEKKLRT